MANGLTSDDLNALPSYHGGAVTREQEEVLSQTLRDRFAGRRRYALPDFRSNDA
jgi:hypothetical protein